MKFFCVNTDSQARDDCKTCDIWFDEKMAFASDYTHEKKKSSKLFERLDFRNVIFAYHSGDGFVGVGLVDEEKWDHRCYDGSQRLLYQGDLAFEYRIKVSWLHDWRSNPKSAKTLGLPVTPYYFCQIDPEKYNVKELFAKLSRGKR